MYTFPFLVRIPEAFEEYRHDFERRYLSIDILAPNICIGPDPEQDEEFSVGVMSAVVTMFAIVTILLRPEV